MQFFFFFKAHPNNQIYVSKVTAAGRTDRGPRYHKGATSAKNRSVDGGQEGSEGSQEGMAIVKHKPAGDKENLS